jgi:hypothetical protein
MVSEEDMGTAIEAADTLQDLMAMADTISSGQRDTSIPEGSTLGETELQGQQVRWKKQKSMVHSGDTPLPERFKAFDTFGNTSMLPTAQMGRMLSKMRADDKTTRAFHTHTRGMTSASCTICPTPKEPISETCEFCLERTNGAVRKVFRSETDAYAHKTRLHPEEFANLERMQERAERAESLAAQREIAATQERLAEAMMAMATQNAKPSKSA